MRDQDRNRLGDLAEMLPSNGRRGKGLRDRVQVVVAGLVSLIKPKWARVFQKSLFGLCMIFNNFEIFVVSVCFRCCWCLFFPLVASSSSAAHWSWSWPDDIPQCEIFFDENLSFLYANTPLPLFRACSWLFIPLRMGFICF